MKHEEKKKASVKRPSLGERLGKFGTMNIILIIVGVSLLAFTIAMMWTFDTYGAIPDTLCTCVFTVLGGECGVMGWIKTSKEKNRDRNWELNDRDHNEALAQSGGRDNPAEDIPPDEEVGG
ncbi:MAG: hypothetical protein LUE24_14665 [Lachnospiraceae bacterium]|nr:hypothetical protein [Lachnospiraceae bacterium]